MDEQSTSEEPVHTTCSEEPATTTMVPHENLTTTSSSSEMVDHQSDCLALDSEDQVQPTTTTSTNSSAPVDPSTAAPQLIEDSLQSDQVEMPAPVMSNEETNVQTTNELESVNDGLQNGPQQASFERDLLSDDLDELSLIADGLDMEEVQCLPPSLADEHTHHNVLAEEKTLLSEENPPATNSSDEQHHSQITESATTTISTTFQQIELDDPIVETVQFNIAGSSAETEFTDENLKEAPLDLEDLDQFEHGEYSQSTTTDVATLLDTDSSKDGTVHELPLATAVSEPEVPDLFKDVKFAISEEMEDLDKVR